MHVHLLSCKSENRLTRRLALNKLEMCMTVMRELQISHTSASLFCGVFGVAIRQLMPGPLNEDIWGVAQIKRPSVLGIRTPGNTQTFDLGNFTSQPTVTEDILESLLNEDPSYNFWESINMPEPSCYDCSEW